MIYTKSDVLLKIDRVSLTLSDHLILRDVSAEVKDIVRPDCAQGQVVCFLGPSGIGKTRLSRIIAGLDKPTSGEVLLPSGVVTRGVVGMVPQNYPLFTFMTVRQNLRTAGQHGSLNPTDLKDKTAQLVELFGLTKYLDAYPSSLSGGTKQRVAIVRQLLCSDHYIVLDEPFSGQDPRMKKRVCQRITQIAQLDTTNTIIIVTHDVTEGMSVADTVWLMGLEKVDGQFVPGARIVKEIDLAARGLCWRDDILKDRDFQDLVADVKQQFEELAP